MHFLPVSVGLSPDSPWIRNQSIPKTQSPAAAPPITRTGRINCRELHSPSYSPLASPCISLCYCRRKTIKPSVQLLNCPTTSDKCRRPSLTSISTEERGGFLSTKKIVIMTKKKNFPPLIWQCLRDRQINRQRAGPWSARQLLRFCSAPVATTEPVPPARPLPLTPRARKDNVLDDIQISLTLDWKAQSPEGQAGQDNIIFSSSRSSARLWSANSGGWNLGNVKCHTENL